MKSSILLLLSAAALPLSACASTSRDSTLASVGTGAAIGAAGGAGVAAVAGGDMLTGAAIGAAVGGIAGAVWADSNNDGRADGYVREGRYYEGAPSRDQAYAPACRSVTNSALTGGAIGGAAGAVIGAVAGGPLAGLLIGAAVGGLGGAVWADANNDGCVDGYVREGRFYEGSPPASYGPVVQPVSYRGERG